MMNVIQARIAAKMLNLASNEFSNHGCNDYELDATPDNLEFVKGMIATSDYPEDEPHINWETMKIYVIDWQVMNYCKQLLLELTNSQGQSSTS